MTVHKRSPVMKRGMIEIAPQALILAAAVVITMVIIALGINQLSKAKDVNSAITESTNNMVNDLRNNEVAQYDGLTVSGADVINFFKKNYGTTATAKCEYTITIGNGTATTTYPSGSLTYKDLSDTSKSATYVRPTDKYECDVSYNANDVLTNIKFTKKIP